MRKVGINLPLLAARSWRRLCLAPFCEEYGEAHQRDSKKNTANRLRHGAPFLLADALWRTPACLHKQAQLASARTSLKMLSPSSRSHGLTYSCPAPPTPSSISGSRGFLRY